jgi:hypothetical protein
MKVVKFPVLATERWTLSRELDNLRFDILSARSTADRLRHKEATQYLADNTSAENLRNTLAHLNSILEFFAELSARMKQAEKDQRSDDSRK